jgi:hypothetical protein
VPGPGSYLDGTSKSNKFGFYVSSRYRCPGNAVISRTGDRFDNSDLRRSGAIPGPGNYKLDTQRQGGNGVIGKGKRIIVLDTGVTRKCKKFSHHNHYQRPLAQEPTVSNLTLVTQNT